MRKRKKRGKERKGARCPFPRGGVSVGGMVVSTGDPKPVEIGEVAEVLPTITVPGQPLGLAA